MHLRLFTFVLVATSFSTLIALADAEEHDITVDSDSGPIPVFADVDPSFFLQPIHLEHCLLDPTLLECTSGDESLSGPTDDFTSESIVMSGSSSASGGANLKYKAPLSGLDAENYMVAPPELELEQVHVYVRHGERTPVSVRMSSPPASIPSHWTLCTQARRFRAAVFGTPPPASPPSISATSSSASPSTSLKPERMSVLPRPDFHGWNTTGSAGGGRPELEVKRVVERGDGSVVDGECLLGELTDIGRKSTYDYGLALRKIYVDKLGFLPDHLALPQDVYFRSTNMPRTIESLQQIVHGLYPMNKCEEVVPLIRIRNGRDENLLGNTMACRRLEVLLVNFAHAAASAYNHTLEPLDKKISKYLDGKPIRVDGQPRASGVLDTIRASMAHGIKVPPEFEEKAVMEPIEKAVVNEWFAGYKTEEVRRLGMGRLLADLSSRFHLKTQEDPTVRDRELEAMYASPSSSSSSASLFSSASASNSDNGGKGQGQGEPRILVHSTHDTALAGLLNTLDVFDDRWPAFTASLTFELFRRNPDFDPSSMSVPHPTTTTSTSLHPDATPHNGTSILVDHEEDHVDPMQPPQNQGVLQSVLGSARFGRRLGVDREKRGEGEYFVRARYQNRNLILPMCADDDKHLAGSPEFCTLSAFRERVDELAPRDWEAECAVGLGSA